MPVTTTPSQRLADIKWTKDKVSKEYYDAMAATTTPEQAQVVDEAYYTSKLAFVKALREGLEANGDKVEGAAAALKKANSDLKSAKAKAESIADFLKKMTKAANLALNLVKLAVL